MSALATVVPGRQELEALPLAERIALEDAFGQAHEVIRQLNDADLASLHAAGASQRAIAEACGKSKGWAQDRLAALGLATDRKAPKPDTSIHPLPQNGDGPVVDAEVVDGEVVPDDRPVQYLPDVVSNEADRDLRTQALRWFEQGRHLEELLTEGAVESRSREDKTAIKREADEMVRIARRLKGAIQ